MKRIYNAFGLIIADQQEHNGAVSGSTPEVTYAFTDGSDNVLRRTAVTAPSGAQVDYTYGSGGSITDIFNQVATLKVNGESDNLVDYTYAGIGRVVLLTYPAPGAQLSYLQPGGEPGQSDAGDSMSGYDRFNRTVRMPWKKTTGGDILADIAYGYDAASRRTWRQDMTPESEAAFDRFYGYDPLGQVKAAERGTLNNNRTAIGGIPEEAEAWNYDEQGNWLKYLKAEYGVPEIDQHRRNNRSNQITTVDGSNAGVAYDKNGNMLRVPTGDALIGAPRHLKWNAWNQLVEVRDDEEELIQRNTYDALFRRTTRELNDSTVIHCYYNDQWRPVEERIDTSTDASAVYFWGDRYRDDLARRDRDTNADGTLDESLWCLMDYFDPIAVIDDEGEVIERYAYSAFGVASILAPNYSVRGSSAIDWNFLFHGQFEDAETGWQNYGYRFYVPELGRWPSRDPIEEEGGSNLYVLTENQSPNLNDQLGLKWETTYVPSGLDAFTVWGKGHSKVPVTTWKDDPPVTKPPVTKPPVTKPPVTKPPVTKPPVTMPPVTKPPVTKPKPPVPRDRIPDPPSLPGRTDEIVKQASNLALVATALMLQIRWRECVEKKGKECCKSEWNAYQTAQREAEQAIGIYK